MTSLQFFWTGLCCGQQSRNSARARGSLEVDSGPVNLSNKTKDMNLQGLELHEVKGDRKGFGSVKVSGKWRVTFSFHGKNTDNVGQEDYH